MPASAKCVQDTKIKAGFRINSETTMNYNEDSHRIWNDTELQYAFAMSQKTFNKTVFTCVKYAKDLKLNNSHMREIPEEVNLNSSHRV